MPPRVVGPYRVLDTLGSGGVGTVYRAIDRRTGESIALKMLSTGPALDPRAARRLAREFETLADLSHPNVVKVYDTGVHQGYPYLAMELVDGLTLREYLTLDDATGPGSKERRRSRDDDLSSELATGDVQGSPFTLSNFNEESPSVEVSSSYVSDPYASGPESVRALANDADEPDTVDSDDPPMPFEMPPPDTSPSTSTPHPIDMVDINRPARVSRLKDAVLQLCQALSYIHAHGLVHRDLKPSNVMVDADRQVRLMDFGLAKFLADESGVTADGRLVGTFRYMAPEQILGEPLDGRADLYSLGVLLYEMLAGRPPFDARTPYELWQKVLETEPAPLLTVNGRGDALMARVAHRLIRKEPNDRYQTAEEVFEALSE